MRLAASSLIALLVLLLPGLAKADLADRAVSAFVNAACKEGASAPTAAADTIVGQAYQRTMQYALNREMQRRLGEERQKQLTGDPSSAGAAVIQDLMDCANDRLLDPVLEAAERNCDYARNGGLQFALGLERQSQLLGGSTGADVMGSAGRALDNCWKEATKDCIEPDDSEKMAYTLGLARQGLLMGADEGSYSISDISVCSTTSLPSAASRQVVDAVKAVGSWFGIGGGAAP
jgi:hypothetical protein